MSDKKTPTPTSQGDVFIAEWTALLPHTTLHSYAGRVNGQGELTAGVLWSDFEEAVSGTRDQGFPRIFGGKALKPNLNLENISRKIIPLVGEHSGHGSPKVALIQVIVMISSALAEARAAGVLRRGSRLERVATQLGMMNAKAAVRGWQMEVFSACGIASDSHRLNGATSPASLDEHRRRIEAKEKRQSLIGDRSRPIYTQIGRAASLPAGPERNVKILACLDALDKMGLAPEDRLLGELEGMLSGTASRTYQAHLDIRSPENTYQLLLSLPDRWQDYAHDQVAGLFRRTSPPGLALVIDNNAEGAS